MNIIYRRELNETWMILSEECEPSPYECRMLEHLSAGRLLKTRIFSSGAAREYAFAVSRGRVLEDLLKAEKLSYAGLRQLFSALSETLSLCNEYLLSPDHLVLRLSCIYAFPDMDSLRFCCHPGAEGSFFDHLTELVEELLAVVDHRDMRAAEALYECHRVCHWPNYRFEDLMAAIGGAGTEPEQAALYGEEEEEPENDGMEEDRLPERGLRGILFTAGKKGFRKETGTRAGRINLFSFLPLLGVAVLLAVYAFLYFRMGIQEWRLFAPAGLLLAYQGYQIYRMRTSVPEKILPLAQRRARKEPDAAACPAGKTSGPDNTTWLAAEPAEPDATTWLDGPQEPEQWVLRPLSREDPVITVSHFPFVIGKLVGEVDFCMKAPAVSRIHARIERDTEGIWLTDCRSTNGTFLEGKRLPPEERVLLGDGARVRFADRSYVWEKEENP